MKRLSAAIIIALVLSAGPLFATVSSTTTQNIYTANGSTTVFPYTFQIYTTADLYVASISSLGVETPITTGFSVSGAGTVTGGNVTFSTAPASGTKILLRRHTVQHQELDLVPNARLNATSLETAYDKLTLIAQDQQNQLDRCVKFAANTSAGSKVPLPEPEAYSYLMWNADETALVNTATGFDEAAADFGGLTVTTLKLGAGAATVTSFGISLVDDASASDARTTLGLGSMATQDASSVAITGGSVAGITDLAVADGGTGASSAAGARTNLGLGSISTQDSSAVSITGGTISGLTSAEAGALTVTAHASSDTFSATSGASANGHGLIEGDAYSGRVLRLGRILITDSATASKITVSMSSDWNADAISAVDIGVSESLTDFSLNSNGSTLTINASSLSGTVLAVFPKASHNSMGTAININGYVSSGNIVLGFSNATSGSAVNLTSLVDYSGGGKGAIVDFLYITNE